MKPFQFLLPLLSLLVEGAPHSGPLEKRQWADLGKTLNSQLSQLRQNVTKIEELKPTLSIPGVKRKRYIFGPYKAHGLDSKDKKGSMTSFPPNFAAWQNFRPGESLSQDPDGTAYVYYTGDDFLSDVTVLKVETSVLTKDLKKAETKDGLYNHHNLWWDTSKPAPMPFGCDFWPYSLPSISGPIAIFSSGGTENISISYANPNEGPGDIKTGYYLNKTSMFNMIDVVNYAKEDQLFYQDIDMEYLDGRPKERLDSRELTFDPLMCNQGKGGYYSGVDIRPNGQKKWTVSGGGIVVTVDGYLTGMRGHLHDGGVNIIMRVNGKEVCNSRALYGGPGHTRVGPNGEIWETINQMTHCRTVTKVSKGDKITTEANYDVELHPSRLVPSNMGGGGGGHGGHQPAGPKTSMKIPSDGGAGEQMGLFLVYFAEAAPSGK